MFFTEFIAYNYQFFVKKRKQDFDLAWWHTSGIMALGLMANVTPIIFIYLGYYKPSIEINYPGYVLVCIPWLFFFLIFLYNKKWKKKAKKSISKPISKKWRNIYWAYYIISILIYANALSYFSKNFYG